MPSFEDKFLKKNFMDPGNLTPMACRKSKVMQLAKKPKMDGKSIAEAAIFDGPQGWSYTYAAAKAVADQTDRGASDYGEFVSNFPFNALMMDFDFTPCGFSANNAFTASAGDGRICRICSAGAVMTGSSVAPISS